MKQTKQILFEKIKENKLHKQGHLRIRQTIPSGYTEIFNLSALTLPNLQNSVLELILLSKLSHENILTQKHIKIDSSLSLAELQFTRSLETTSLERLMLRGVLEPNHLKYIMFQLFSLVNYFHFNGVVARNLSPANLTVSSSSHVSFCDFSGMRLRDAPNKSALEHRLDINYAAPELSLNLGRNFFASDVWSLGCILFELAEHRPLFRVNNSLDLLRAATQCLGTPAPDEELAFISSKGTLKWLRSQPFARKQPISAWMQGTDPLLRDLLDRCLKIDPRERLSAAEALEHPFFAELYDSEEERKSLKKHISSRRLRRLFSIDGDKGRVNDYFVAEMGI